MELRLLGGSSFVLEKGAGKWPGCAPLFSGSTGNSYYIGTRSAGLLLTRAAAPVS